MVLTRLSHFGEVCPLSDHSYSDPASPSTSSAPQANRRFPVANMGARLSPTSTVVSSSSPMPLHHHHSEEDMIVTIHILELPVEIFEKIFSYLTYKNIGEIRRTCKRFDQIGSNVLNGSFLRLQNQMLQRFQSIKGRMPRRESARRKHPLARESDIIETLHMRLTLLQSSFGKHIERKHCCFFAGDILDEVYRILLYIKNTPVLGRAYKVTDELCDLSTMAMEYFHEEIEPRLPDFLDITTRFSEACSARSPSGSGRVSEPEDEPERDPLPPSNMILRKRIRRIRQGMRRYNTQLVALRRELKGCKGKLAEQNKQMLEYATRMDEYDKKFEESSRKFSTVLQELNKCKTELQYWRSKSPAQPLLCYNCGQSVGGEGSVAQIQGGILMPGGEDAVVYVPFPASVPESAQKGIPQGAASNREDGHEKWHTGGGSVRNLERAFDLDLSMKSKAVSEAAGPTPPVAASHPTALIQSGLAPATQVPPSLPPASHHPVPACKPEDISCQVVSSPSQISTAHPVPATSTSSSSSSSLVSPHSFSAFQACHGSRTYEVWYGGQECAEDLSMSRSYKHYLDDDGESEFRSRYSDDEGDGDDTVGRRVKERKRIKLDIF